MLRPVKLFDLKSGEVLLIDWYPSFNPLFIYFGGCYLNKAIEESEQLKPIPRLLQAPWVAFAPLVSIPALSVHPPKQPCCSQSTMAIVNPRFES